MEGYPLPDKYIHPHIMVGYGLQDYINDIRDGALDLNFPYILIHLGALQLGKFDSRVVQKQVIEFMKLIVQITPKSLVIFSGLVP